MSTRHWLPHAVSGLARMVRVRWATRGGFTVGDTPAFHPDAVAWFHDAVDRSSHYIEYGSGASTLIAAAAGVRTISMEADARYADAVCAALPGNAPVTLMRADIGLTAEWSFPVFTRPTPARLARWRHYAVAPVNLARAEGWAPQLALVDGRFRVACALHVARLAVASGTRCEMLFDDYLPRAHYHVVEAELGRPRMIGISALFTVGPGTPSQDSDLGEARLAKAARDWR